MIARLKAALPSGLTIEAAADYDTTKSGVEVRAFSLVNLAGAHAPFYLLPGLNVEISASEIREGISAQIHSTAKHLVDVTNLLPPTVAGYIRSHGLYQGSSFRLQR
jgi:nicotinate-nucleotide adenylyltransferase